MTATQQSAAATAAHAELETASERRSRLKDRHVQALSELLAERDDLRGVHALADFVDESVRWTA